VIQTDLLIHSAGQGTDRRSQPALRLTPAQALAAATLNAAFAVGRGSQVGSLEVDKIADILIIEASDYRHLGYRFGGNLVETVIKAGRIVKG